MRVPGVESEEQVAARKWAPLGVADPVDDHLATQITKNRTPAPYGAVISCEKPRQTGVGQDDAHLDAGRAVLDCRSGSRCDAAGRLLDESSDLPNFIDLALLKQFLRLGNCPATPVEHPVGILNAPPEV